MRPALLTSLPLWIACTPGTISVDLGAGSDPGASGVEQIGPADQPSDTGTEPEPDPAKIFNLDAVHEVEITIPDEGVRSLRSDPYGWVVSDVTFDGQAFVNAGARIKGRLGSLRDMNGKCGWKIDVQQFGSDATLEGLQSFGLGNMVQDGAMVHQVAAYAIYRAAGVPVPRVGYAWVRVNGEDYGLYVLTEEYDDEFLDANYAEPGGNLYDGDYVMWPDGSYTLLDFYTDYVELFEQDEGGTTDRADLRALVASLDAGEPLDTMLDTEQFARMMAVDAWIGHWDSYNYNWNNFRVYFDPADGRAELLPWDLDQPFYDDMPFTAPVSRLGQACLADAACSARFREVIGDLGQTIEAAGVPESVEQAIGLIGPYARRDPRREQSMDTLLYYQQHLRDWLGYRQAVIDAQL